jgi:hypothetical protein
VNLTLPIIVAAVVIVAIVGPMLGLHGRAAKWRTYISKPAGIATLTVSLDLPPGWQIREEGTSQDWGVRVLRAAPEEKVAAGQKPTMLSTELLVTCSKIPQDQTLDQYMTSLSRSNVGGTFQMQPHDVAGLPGYWVTLRQVQQQRLAYVSPPGSGLMYVLKLACRPEESEAMQPLFDQVLQSFRINQ